MTDPELGAIDPQREKKKTREIATSRLPLFIFYTHSFAIPRQGYHPG